MERLLTVIKDKCKKIEVFYQEAKLVGKKIQLRSLVNSLRNKKNEWSAQVSQAKNDQRKAVDEALKSKVPIDAFVSITVSPIQDQTTSMDHQCSTIAMDCKCDDRGVLIQEEEDMPRDWKFENKYYEDLFYQIKLLSCFKFMVKKLSKHLYQDLLPLDIMELSASMTKMKIEVQWDEWEATFPKMYRGG